MNPWLDDGDVQLYHGDALAVLRSLPAGSVQTCVTSPPYWGLRDYGTGSWTGGSLGCDHARPISPRRDSAGGFGNVDTRGTQPNANGVLQQYGEECAKCGARRVDAQLGLERTPGEYVAALVAVFAEVWRVLRPDGTVWCNLGDSYASDAAKGGSGTPNGRNNRGEQYARPGLGGLKAKDLVGIPWKVAFALQEAGWYLRSDIVWAKPNPMPESVTDRPTKAHEYVFLLAKQPRYYWDADAIREPHQLDGRAQTKHLHGTPNSHENYDHIGNVNERWPNGGRNARSVWEIATQPTPEAHFATMPEALVRRCILAASSEAGGCAKCGAPWQRVVEGAKYEPPTAAAGERFVDASRGDKTRRLDGKSAAWREAAASRATTGWVASCACGAPPVPQTVLDPFVGSGTTALVARKHGRRAIGVDLSVDYLAIAARRLGQQSLFATSEGVA